MPSGPRTAEIAKREVAKFVTVGNVFYVDSGHAAKSDSAGQGFDSDTPFATLDYAIGRCEANNGDVIYVAPGHAETKSDSGALFTADIAGISIIGLGNGADRPTLTYTHTGATATISANGVLLRNLLFVAGIDSITTFATISGADCTLEDIETRDTTDIEVITDFTITGDRPIVRRMFKNGYTGGNANVRVLSLNGVDRARIEDSVFVTKVTTAVIGFVTVASTGVVVKGCTFSVDSTTDGSKNVVDTVTGSTWAFHDNFDLTAGAAYSGGSGSALASDDVSAVNAKIGTLTNSGGTATLGGILGDVANTTIATHFAKTGTIVNTGGTATVGGVLGDFANASLVARLGVESATDGIANILSGTGGITTWKSAAAPATGVSISEVLRAIYDRMFGDGTDASTNVRLGKRVTKATADTITGAAVPIFTVGTGRVLLLALYGEVTTIIGAGANNARLIFNPTTGTTNNLCADLDIDADEAGAIYSITGVPADAMLRSESGAVRNMSANGIILNLGDIEFTTAANVTGSIQWTAWYMPLDNGATLVSA
jgi:hypothetical protein